MNSAEVLVGLVFVVSGGCLHELPSLLLFLYCYPLIADVKGLYLIIDRELTILEMTTRGLGQLQ